MPKGPIRKCSQCGEMRPHDSRGLCGRCRVAARRSPGWRPLRLPTFRERLLSQISLNDPSGCMPWTGRLNPDGYGVIRAWPTHLMVHRAIWEMFEGSIPEGMCLDHLCHTTDPKCQGGTSCPHRRCANVTHLELVTHAENTRRGGNARKTHCPQGHEYTPENTYRFGVRGARRCKTCITIANREQRRERIRKQRADRAEAS